MKSKHSQRVALIIGSIRGVRVAISDGLQKAGYRVSFASSSDHARAALAKSRPDLLIVAEPFSKTQLFARVSESLGRVQSAEEAAEVFRSHGLILRIPEHSVELDGRPVALSRREFELLAVFLERSGHVLNRRFLLERAWGGRAELQMNSKTVDVTVGRLRARLGSWGRRIETVPNYGYRLDVSD